MTNRAYSPFDNFIMHLDQGLRTVFGAPQTTGRANPADAVASSDLAAADKALAGRLMRVNHAGEVAAQGLYQGQALTARLPNVREKMEHAAQEENDHLVWCEQRCKELGTHTSVLDPLWYAGAMAIGATAGAIGDKWSLGFLAETEHQVVEHLSRHLQRLPTTTAMGSMMQSSPARCGRGSRCCSVHPQVNSSRRWSFRQVLRCVA